MRAHLKFKGELWFQGPARGLSQLGDANKVKRLNIAGIHSILTCPISSNVANTPFNSICLRGGAMVCNGANGVRHGGFCRKFSSSSTSSPARTVGQSWWDFLYIVPIGMT